LQLESSARFSWLPDDLFRYTCASSRGSSAAQ
jgi:hypothetical protein